ncbi:hypothetical protein ACWGIB_05190 [Streptomyces xiamenensis]
MTGDTAAFPCPDCGHRRTSAHCWNCDVGDSADRTEVLHVVTAVVTTAALHPFIAAIATRAGEEVWPKISGLVRPWRRRRIDARLAGAERLETVARDSGLILDMPKRLPAEAARDLRNVVEVLDKADGRFRVSYDAATRTWDITPADRQDGQPDGGPSDGPPET